MKKFSFVIWCAFFVSSVISIRVHNEGVKTKSFHVDPQLSEALRDSRQHQGSYIVSQSRTVSNGVRSEYSHPPEQRRDATVTYQGSTRGYRTDQGNIVDQGRPSYAYVEENNIASYLTECPPNATGQFAYLYDCRRFLNCWKGRGYIQSCGPGTVFNPDTLECDNPKKVNCFGLGNPSKSDGYDTSPETSARYTQQTSSSSHMPRTIFATTTTTTRSGPVQCTQGFSGMEAHPYDCTKFLNCANGVTHIQSCGPGTVFIPSMGVCDIAKNFDCGNRARLVEDRTYPSRTTVVTSTTRNYEVKCSPDAMGIEPHPYDCTKFLNCAHGMTHIQSCGPGTVFNSLMSVCDFPYRVDCGNRAIESDSSTSSSTTYEIRRPVGNTHQIPIKPTTQPLNVPQYGDQQHGGYTGRIDVQKSEQVFGQSSQGFGQSSQGFGQPSQGFGQPSQGFGQPSQGFGQFPQTGQSSQTHGFEQSTHSRGFAESSSEAYPRRPDINQQPTRPDHQHRIHQHGHIHSIHNHQHPHGHSHDPQYNTPNNHGTNQQYNWTVISGSQPSSNQEYNWTRTVTTYPGSRRNYTWSGSEAGYPSQATTNINAQKPYHDTTWTQTQAWPHQTPQSKEFSVHGTSSSTNNFDYSEDTQRQERPFGINSPSSNQNQPNQGGVDLGNWYRPPPPPTSSSSTTYHSQQATVQQYPQSNFNVPLNVSDSGPLSTTTTIYYAQPVEDSEEIFNNVSGGDIPATDDFHKPHGATRILTGGVKQFFNPVPSNPARTSRDYTSNVDTDSSSASSGRGDVIYRINTTLTDYRPRSHDSPIPVPSPHLLPPFPPSSTTSGSSAVNTTFIGYDSNPIPVPSPHLLPPFPPSSAVNTTLSDYNSNLYGGLLPPHADTSKVDTVRINTTITDYDSNLYGGLLPPRLDTSTVPDSPNYMLPPYPPLYNAAGERIDVSQTFSPNSTNDSFSSSSIRNNVFVHVNSSSFDSNLYGGLMPPNRSPESSKDSSTTKTNIRIFKIFPPLENATFGVPTENISPPIYSPPYSSISHSRNWSSVLTPNLPSREILPPINPWVHSSNKAIVQNPVNVTNAEMVPSPNSSNSTLVVFDRETTYPSETKVIPLFIPPPTSPSTVAPFSNTYNREYYKQTAGSGFSETGVDEMSQLPISEAVKALLRPYLNRSGTVKEEDVQKTETFIMKLSKSTPEEGTKQEPNVDEHKTEDSKKIEPSKHEKEVELIFTGEQENLNQGASRGNHNHSRPHYGHPHSHWHNNPEFHSQEFHRNHPHLRTPFSSNANNPPSKASPPPDSETITAPDLFAAGTNYRTTTPTYYPSRGKGREFEDNGQTTISLDRTFSKADVNEGNFDCRNGKWVKDFEVCDGVNNCGNRMDESYCDHLGYEIRLSNEDDSKNMGRVEVKVLGKWGYVCDDKFGMRDADVLCRELGFPLGASEVRGNSFYPPHAEMIGPNGDVLFVMDEVDCKGNESSLRDCDFKGWGVHDCSADEVVGVVCKIPVMKCPLDFWLCKTSKECIPPAFVCDNVPDCADKSDESDAICNSNIEYRLADGDGRMEGRVEVKYQGIWGTVCDDDFTETEAQVVCESLGFHGDSRVVKNAFGPGIGPIWLDQVSCFGNESSIDKCSHWTWGEHNCNHTEDVSIRCLTGIRQPVNVGGVKGVKGGKGRSSTIPHELNSEEIDPYPYVVQRSSKILHEHFNCGIISPNITDEFESVERLQRVVQGSRAKRGHHPWQATIRTRGRSGKSNHWCGAVLISPRHLLTAAHCLAGYGKGAYFVRLGDHYADIAESSEIDINIENWHVHEQFRKGTHMNNDIALIVLKRPVRFNDYVHPICLPARDSKYEEGRECVISGWGSIQSGISTPANHLRAAKIPIISQNVCKQPHVYGNAITDGMFCAGYLDESVDACDGDSGGPLVCRNNDVETLFGIISWGQHCGYANKPGVYVKISNYIDWIYEKLGVSPNTIGDIR